jgi:hypothetical protein
MLVEVIFRGSLSQLLAFLSFCLWPNILEAFSPITFGEVMYWLAIELYVCNFVIFLGSIIVSLVWCGNYEWV